MTDSTASPDPPPFIYNQGMQLLVAAPNVRKCISAADAREPGRDEEPGMSTPEAGRWESVDRWQVAQNSVPGVALRRLALVSDAGMGKLTTCEWLQLAAYLGQGVAFLVQVDDLPDSPEQFLETTLVDLLLEPDENSVSGLPPNQRSEKREEARRRIVRLCRAGEAMLVFDGLDQAEAPQVKKLGRILRDPLLSGGRNSRGCRMVLAGRSYAFDPRKISSAIVRNACLSRIATLTRGRGADAPTMSSDRQVQPTTLAVLLVPAGARPRRNAVVAWRLRRLRGGPDGLACCRFASRHTEGVGPATTSSENLLLQL